MSFVSATKKRLLIMYATFARCIAAQIRQVEDGSLRTASRRSNDDKLSSSDSVQSL